MGCYGINERTTEIGSLNSICVKKGAWTEIVQSQSTQNIKDSIFADALQKIKGKPFTTEVLFFHKDPQELIAVDNGHYSVRYVFNPAISKQVLDGLCSELSDLEKKRIRNRVLKLLIEYQCEEGKKTTNDQMNE